MSTAGEEQALYWPKFMRLSSTMPPELSDILGNNEAHWCAEQWTITGLRVPQGLDPQHFDVDAEGRKYWRRIVLMDDKEVGEMFVPEGNNRAVSESDSVYGIPRTTIDQELFVCDFSKFDAGFKGKYVVNNVRFLFNPAPESDSVSGQRDVAITYCGYACQTEGVFGLTIDASKLRHYASANTGFRPVAEMKSDAGAGLLEKTRAQQKPPQIPKAEKQPLPQINVLTESARDILRQTESSSERFRRKMMERPVDNLLRQMREPPRWQPPYRM